MLAQQYAIDKRRDTSFLAQVTWHVSRRCQSRHHDAVNNEQCYGNQKLCPDLRRQKDQRRYQVTDRDPLQHAGDADGSELKIWKAVEKQSEAKNDRGAFDYLEIQVTLDSSLFNTTRKRKRDRNADDEEEEREDEIGRRPTMPLSVFQRPVDTGPCAGIINEHHAGDCDSAKDVERDQAASRGHGAKITTNLIRLQIRVYPCYSITSSTCP